MVTKPMTKPILTDLQKRPLIQSLSSLIPLLKGQISPQMSKKADPQANRSPATLPNYIALGASHLFLPSLFL